MDREHTKNHFPYLYVILTTFVTLQFVYAINLCSFAEMIDGLITIIMTEDSLITDYVRIAGPGPALFNSALVTTIALTILYESHESHNGLTLVVAALGANTVGEIVLAALGALCHSGSVQLPNVGASLVSASLGYLFLRNCHFSDPP